MSARIGEALNALAKIDQLVGHKITQKWIFVDLLWLIMQKQAEGARVDAAKAAARYRDFEKRRREFNSRPEALIRGKGPHPQLNQHLYNYILAFRTQGGQKANLQMRNAAFRAFFRNIEED